MGWFIWETFAGISNRKQIIWFGDPVEMANQKERFRNKPWYIYL